MNLAIYALLIVASTFDWLRSIHVLPNFAPYTVEALELIVVFYALFTGVQTRFQNIRASYALTYGFLALVMLCGSLANTIAVGPAFAGVRIYARAIPMFFLPSVFAIQDKALRRQFLLILFICILQLPIAISQRWHNYGHVYASGDRTFGTMMLSGWLSIFLICAACVLTGLWMRKRIRLILYLPLLFLILAPTMINETKVTLFLVPIGLVATFVAGSNRGVRLRNSVLAVFVSLLFLAVFVPVYDWMEGARNKEGLLSMVTSEKFLGGYMSSNAQVGANEKKPIGRWDSVVVPWEFIAHDPAQFMFGLGPGNASVSSLGSQFSGRYMGVLNRFLDPTSSRITAELGLLGLLGTLILNWLIFRDSRYVADSDEGLVAALAVGWSGVVPIVMISLFYTGIISATALSVTYWYFSGVIVARRTALARQQQEASDTQLREAHPAQGPHGPREPRGARPAPRPTPARSGAGAATSNRLRPTAPVRSGSGTRRTR